jgi:hypothetical protein
MVGDRLRTRRLGRRSALGLSARNTSLLRREQIPERLRFDLPSLQGGPPRRSMDIPWAYYAGTQGKGYRNGLASAHLVASIYFGFSGHFCWEEAL